MEKENRSSNIPENFTENQIVFREGQQNIFLKRTQFQIC